jgi:2-(1,2-epoxy-1,2-dihydrophenyl)acetyl-CoA isomerase
MPDYTAILYDLLDGVATLTLNRPEAANSLNEVLSTEMLDAIIRAEENPAVRALVLTATGRFFCAGADLRSFLHRSEHAQDASLAPTSTTIVIKL